MLLIQKKRAKPALQTRLPITIRKDAEVGIPVEDYWIGEKDLFQAEDMH